MNYSVILFNYLFSVNSLNLYLTGVVLLDPIDLGSLFVLLLLTNVVISKSWMIMTLLLLCYLSVSLSDI